MPYAISKTFSKEPEKFGTGHVEGIVNPVPEQQRNGGRVDPRAGVRHSRRLDPAIVIGVPYMKNMNPGPPLFINNPQKIYAVYLQFGDWRNSAPSKNLTAASATRASGAKASPKVDLKTKVVSAYPEGTF
jgi:hypothetical protein